MDREIPFDMSEASAALREHERRWPSTCPWEALERIVRLYPNSAPALIARSALARRNTEEKA